MFPDFAALIARVDASLRAELPGSAAHTVLSPRPRREWPARVDPAAVRHAAVLLLLFPVADRAHTVLTIRADTLDRHGGQVALPGGVIEPGETLEQAALREAHEEIGLATETVRVLGALTPLDIPVSGFRIHPVVAMIGFRPGLTAADGEVARIVEVAVDDLLDASSLLSTEGALEGELRVVPAFHVAGLEIWGATAMVLAEFLTLLGWNRDI